MAMTGNVYINLGAAPAWGNRCQAWVEQQLLGHTGVYANPVAAESSPDFHPMTNAMAFPPGVEVIFGPAASNEGLGHAGVSTGNGQMRSVWSDGSLIEESISRFASDNGAALAGWQNFGRPVAASPAPVSAALNGAAPGFLAGLPANVRKLLPVGAALIGAAIVADALFGRKEG